MKQSNRIIHRHLSNGMEVYLHENAFAPIVSLQALVKVGSIDEDEEEGGMAHVLEHMLFKGTEKFPQLGQVASTVEFEGGDINAYTTFDHTNYHLTAPSSFAFAGTELLLDVVQNSLLEETELAKELEVIREEIRRGRDNPNAVVSHNLFSLFYCGTRLARPVIGYEHVVEKFTRQKVYDFYKKWVTPNNMIFIAAGDFDAEKLMEYMEKITKKMPPSSVPERFRPPFPGFVMSEQNKSSFTPRVLLQKGPWQEARVQFCTESPLLEEAEMPLWDVFSSILGENDTSRLVRILRDELQLVTSVDCSCYTPKYPKGLFGVGFFARAQNVLPVLKMTVQEIRRLAEVPPTREELDRVLNSLKAHRVYAQESMDGIARTAGMSLQTSLKMDFEEAYIKKVSMATPQDIQQIAQKIQGLLSTGQFVISAALSDQVDVSCIEQEWIQSVLHVAQEGQLREDCQEKEKGEPKDFFMGHGQRSSSLNSEIKQIKISLPHNKKLHINYRQSQRLPITSGVLVTKAGLCSEPKEKNGVAGLCANMLTRGTQRQNYRKFIEELEDNASSLSAFSSRDLFGIRFDSMTDYSLRTVQMMLDAIFKPEFSQQEWQKLHRETLETITAQKDHASVQLSKLSQPLLFPHHPYANGGIGTEESLSLIQKEDVVAYWRELFRAEEYVFSLAGQFDLKSVVNLIETEFLAFFEELWNLDENIALLDASWPQATDKRVAFHEMQREQTHLSLSFRSLPLSSPHRAALEIAANILAGQGGRLFLDLRDQKSLAYSVGASQSPNLRAGSFQTYIACSYQKTEEALEGLKRHLEDLAKTPPSAKEVQRAQRSLIGSQSIESQHHSYQASQLAMSDIYGLGFDHFLTFPERILCVQPEQVSIVLKKLLKKNPPIIAAVGHGQTWMPSSSHPLLSWNLT